MGQITEAYVRELLRQIEELEQQVKFLKSRVAALPATKLPRPVPIAATNEIYWGLVAETIVEETKPNPPIKCINCEE